MSSSLALLAIPFLELACYVSPVSSSRPSPCLASFLMRLHESSVEFGPTVDSLVDFRPADLGRIPWDVLDFRPRFWIGFLFPCFCPNAQSIWICVAQSAFKFDVWFYRKCIGENNMRLFEGLLSRTGWVCEGEVIRSIRKVTCNGITHRHTHAHTL